MLSQVLDLNRIDSVRFFDHLYNFFERDFVANRTYLATKIYIDPQCNRKEDGKEQAFWHLTSRKQKYQQKKGKRYETVIDRLPDFRRSERIEWVKQIIDNHDNSSVKCFYHKETTGSKPIRFYLWAYQENFVVILQKLGRSRSFLVTSFYIDKVSKRRTYQKRFDEYTTGKRLELLGCEWF